jgi:hypothetical protein
MAINTTHKLFIDLERGVPYLAFGNFAQVPVPVFYQGDTAQLELHLVRNTGRGDFPMEDVPFPAATITAAVGTPGSTPVASGTTWTAISAPAATVSSGVLTVPRAAISGSFTLSATNTSPSLSATTAAIPLGSTPSDIAAAIVAAVNGQSGWSVASANVQQVGPGVYSVTATATNTSVSYALTLALGTSSLVGPSGYVGELAFTAAGVGTLLGSATSVNSTFEVQVVDDGKVQTYLQIPCVIRKELTAPAP